MLKTKLILITFIIGLVGTVSGVTNGGDFMDNYILKHYPSSSVNQLRAYSCEDLSSMCSWVEYKDAVLDKNCKQIYPKDSLKRAPCLKVVGREDIFFGSLRNCEKDNSDKRCLKDWRYN